jgi:L-threonylcarbamoyladenylate synthase
MITKRLAADDAGLAEAAAMLASGQLVAFPTETVYGLGCDATNPAAVARLYAAKGRPSFNPLIAHCADGAQAMRHAAFSATAQRLAGAFWPGPLTLVLPLATNSPVCELARAGLMSIALRVPAHPAAQRIIAAAGRPIAAPSANRSGHISPTKAAHVLADLDGLIDAVVMGEDAPIGLESTILAIDEDETVLLRAGGVPREAIETLLGRPLCMPADGSEARPVAPGRLASHYAPRAAMRLDAKERLPGEAALDFAGKLGVSGPDVIDLSPSGDLVEAASRLYASLRALDAGGAFAIAVAPIPATGLGEAINDRLRRAAAPRDGLPIPGGPG